MLPEAVGCGDVEGLLFGVGAEGSAGVDRCLDVLWGHAYSSGVMALMMQHMVRRSPQKGLV